MDFDLKIILVARNQARKQLLWSRKKMIMNDLDLGGCSGAENKLINLRSIMEMLMIVC